MLAITRIMIKDLSISVCIFLRIISETTNNTPRTAINILLLIEGGKNVNVMGKKNIQLTIKARMILRVLAIVLGYIVAYSLLRILNNEYVIGLLAIMIFRTSLPFFELTLRMLARENFLSLNFIPCEYRFL